jgi:DNA polymerase-4
MDREIIHVDIAAFAVAVEQVVRPELRHRPVVVAPVGLSRAFVMALSREAWHSGVRKGMPLGKAIRYCRGVTVLPPNEPLYERASGAICRVLQRFSPTLEPAGYGHAFLDLTGTERLFGPPRDVAWRARNDIRRELRLDTSVGLASNKMVSRIAAVVMKPTGFHEVPSGEEPSFLAPLPVDLLPGVGPKTRQQLEELNIRIVRDIIAVDAVHLALAFGRLGFLLRQRALGIDDTPVYPLRRIPAVELERALSGDSNDFAVLRDSVFLMCESAGERLRSEKQRAGSLELRIRYSDYREGSGKTELVPPAQSTAALTESAERLLEKCLTRRTRVRSLFLRLGDLSRGAVQLELFADRADQRQARLDSAIDVLRRRFGPAALKRRESRSPADSPWSQAARVSRLAACH